MKLHLLLLLPLTVSSAVAGERTSTNYSIVAEIADRGGQRTGSTNYTHDGSVGLISGTSTTTPPTGVLKSGYVAQLDFDDKNPPLTFSLSGTISYCANPVPGPVPNVTLTLTGSGSGSTLSDGSGNYALTSLASGGNYVVTPTKTARLPASTGINTVDVIATQRHFLNVALLSGCRLTAADVNLDTSVNTVDVIAIQRFFLGLSTGIANVGKYKFTPVNRTYTGITTNQTAQNFDALIFGDVASSFVHRPEGRSQDAAGDGASAGEVAATVATLSLPNVAVDAFVNNFILQVTTTAIDAKNKLVGFQGDFTFDERVVSFRSEPVQKAGITGGNWNVSGNVLPGAEPIRTLRISAYSNDFVPLNGSGTLFELRMTRVSKAARGTQLIWAAPPDQFIFIDADLNTQSPGNAAPGSVSPSGKRQLKPAPAKPARTSRVGDNGNGGNGNLGVPPGQRPAPVSTILEGTNPVTCDSSHCGLFG